MRVVVATRLDDAVFSCWAVVAAVVEVAVLTVLEQPACVVSDNTCG